MSELVSSSRLERAARAYYEHFDAELDQTVYPPRRLPWESASARHIVHAQDVAKTLLEAADKEATTDAA